MTPSLEVTIWDVQHGSAAFIKTPTGKTLVVDLGVGSFKNPSDSTFSPLKHLHDKLNYRSLDSLIITHPHTDHIDDIGNLGLLRPAMILAPKAIDRDIIRKANKPNDKPKIDTYFSWIDYYNNPVTVGKEMSNPIEWGCSIQWFFPVYNESNLNNYSIVTMLSYAGSTIVIPGDNEAPSWKSLLEQPKFVAAIKSTNIFVASHHGRESGYYSDLFTHFKPKLCILSDTNDIPTSVSDKYSYQAEGWSVFNSATKTFETRKALTTRSDDTIHIKCWSQTDPVTGKLSNQMRTSINLGSI